MIGPLLGLAVRTLVANRLRTLLSGLGVTVGIAAAIAMVCIGRGTAARLNADIARLGGDVITLEPGQVLRGGIGASMAAEMFSLADVEAISDQVRGIRHIGGAASQALVVVGRGGTWQSTATGATNGWLKARRLRLSAGRWFSDYEQEIGKAVCVLGATVHRRLVGRHTEANETIRLKTIACEVIGVLAAQGRTGGPASDDNSVILPLSAFQRRVLGKQDVHSIVLTATSPSANERVKSRIEALMSERRRTTGSAQDFTVTDVRQVAAVAAGSARTMTALLGAVAAISLLVGGIGIMNVMLASVRERTREIGIMLAVGATPGQVRMQMLLETTMLSLFSSALGIVAGLSATRFAADFLQVPFVPDAAIIMLSPLVAVLIGLLFGFGPAANAARLDPNTAMRNS